jgi:hypothetical protein
MDDDRRNALLKEYGEVRSDFRTLTDIRFRLLGILPIASAAVSAFGTTLESTYEFALSLFGLVVTLGLVSYNERNNQLYDELVGRSAAIERSLGLPDGAFATRPRAWLTLRLGGLKWKVDHGYALSLIYSSSIALWLFGVLVPVIEWANAALVQMNHVLRIVNDDKSMNLLIHATAIVASVSITGLSLWSLSRQKDARQEQMRCLARSLALQASTKSLSELPEDESFVKDCALLAGGIQKPRRIGEESLRIQNRLRFYATTSAEDSIGYYLLRSTPQLQAAHIVGLVTDLSPRWVFDCLTNRQGEPDARSDMSQ